MQILVTGNEALCSPDCSIFSELVETAATEIAKSKGAQSPERMVAVAAVRKARSRASQLVEKHTKRIEEIKELSQKARLCNGNRGCLVKVGRTFLEKAKLIYHVVGTTFGTEKETRARLAQRTEQMAESWIRENRERLWEMSLSTKEVGELRILISDRLRQGIEGRRMALMPFFREMGGHFSQAFKALSFGELRNDKIVRTDYVRNLFTVLSLQVGAQLLHVVGDFVAGNTLRIFDKLWIYGNTTFMISIQSEVGARNQRRPEKPLPIHNFREAMVELPNILTGEQGYWRDSQRKLFGFLALLPLEYAVTVVAREVNVAMQHGTSALMNGGTQLEIALVNLASTAIFGSYLSLRWALLDKWLYLNLLPSMRASSGEMAKQKLDLLKAAHLIPKDWSVKDFYIAAKEVNRPQRRFPWFEGQLPESVGKELMVRPQALQELLLTEDAKILLETYRTSTRAQRFEWAWRYGTCLADSYIIFGLFGSWVPRLLGY